jgi:hypothetical protein
VLMRLLLLAPPATQAKAGPTGSLPRVPEPVPAPLAPPSPDPQVRGLATPGAQALEDLPTLDLQPAIRAPS